MSAADELTAINTAISAITSGAQEYQIGTRRIRRADLKLLLDERRVLEAQIADQAGCSATVAYFDRR
jgi:hypothetical protein